MSAAWFGHEIRSKRQYIVFIAMSSRHDIKSSKLSTKIHFQFLSFFFFWYLVFANRRQKGIYKDLHL
jgi:hypothetical protein